MDKVNLTLGMVSIKDEHFVRNFSCDLEKQLDLSVATLPLSHKPIMVSLLHSLSFKFLKLGRLAFSL